MQNNVKMEDENSSEELVEVEVVPQTVNEIIYLEEEDIEVYEDQNSIYIPAVAFDDDENDDEMSSVPIDNDVVPYLAVTLQESQEDGENEFTSYSDNLAEDIMLARSAVKCGINLYECKLCNKRFKSWKFISTHMVTHGEEWKINLSKKKINCTQCRMTFDDPRALTYHFQSQHDVPKSFICDICSCSFVSENGLAGHYKKHFHPKEFVCHICNAGYDSLIDIENHYKTHRTNLLYACNKCDAGFAGTVELSAHIRHAHPRLPAPKAVPLQNNFQQQINQKLSHIFYPTANRKILSDVVVSAESEPKSVALKDVKVEPADSDESQSVKFEPPTTTTTTATEKEEDHIECQESTKNTKKRGRSKKKALKKSRKS